MSKLELFSHEIMEENLYRFYNKDRPEEEYLIRAKDLISAQILLVKILYNVEDKDDK